MSAIGQKRTAENVELRQEAIVCSNKAAVMRTARRSGVGPLGHAPRPWMPVGTLVIRIAAEGMFFWAGKRTALQGGD